jgi:beta-lysine 5,6-aminomutase alpha subunit
LLEKLREEGLFTALEKGYFANIRRSRDGGKGLEGVTRKSSLYMNPYIELLKGNK